VTVLHLALDLSVAAFLGFEEALQVDPRPPRHQVNFLCAYCRVLIGRVSLSILANKRQALEFCNGGSLFNAMKNGILGPTEKMFVILGTASAMAHLHGHGICHHCIERAHILLDSHRHPKIYGFAFIQRFPFDDSDSTLLPVGRCGGYNAPGLSDSKSCYYGPFPSDVYSYALMMSDMLSGALLQPHWIKRKVSDLQCFDVPGCLKELIGQCLDANPLRRPVFHEITEVPRPSHGCVILGILLDIALIERPRPKSLGLIDFIVASQRCAQNRRGQFVNRFLWSILW
jgi:serine/threonine protein kinase